MLGFAGNRPKWNHNHFFQVFVTNKFIVKEYYKENENIRIELV
jgi:hypothetical protein